MAEKDMITMSREEAKRLHIIHQAIDKKISQTEAASLVSLSDRQIRRMIKRIRKEGDEGICHRSRGKISNRCIPKKIKDKTLKLGDTRLELTYLGLNHSDSSIVMRLPKEKVLFAVDFIPVGSVPGRGMIDSYPMEWEDSLKKVMAMEWDRLIPGHPGPGGRLGTKDDVQNLLTFLQDASAAVKAEAQAGKCWDGVEKELKLPKYASWPGYENNLPFVLRRYCGLWGRGT